MATTNFQFVTLTGTETAGYNSINALLASIDSQLNTSNRLIYMAGGTPSNGQALAWDASNSRWSAATLTASALANGAVTEAKIATDAVTSDKIAANAVGASELADDAVDTNSIVNGAVTAGKLASTLDLSSKTVTLPSTSVTAGMLASTLDLTGKTITVATASPGDNDTSVASTAFVSTAVSNAFAGTGIVGETALQDDAVTAAKLRDDASVDANRAVTTNHIRDLNVTYPKLSKAAKSYGFVSYDTAGTYTLPSTVLSSHGSVNSNPLVVCTSTGTITLNISTTSSFTGDDGATITIMNYGTGSVVIAPVSAFINGSSSNTYTLAGQYSVVTLICLNGASKTWVITGDYI